MGIDLCYTLVGWLVDLSRSEISPTAGGTHPLVVLRRSDHSSSTMDFVIGGWE